MAWDDSKDTFRTRPSVPVDEKLTSDEWNDHVSDQKSHSGRHESGGIDEISVEGLGGDLADPQDPKQEAVDDFVNALLAGGNNITTSYDDANDTLTIDTSALNTEEVGDAVDALLTAGNAINLSYDDGAGTLTIDVVDSNIDHDALSNYVADEHVAHSGVNITAGRGLTGGGDITASRTLNGHDVAVQTGNYTAAENDIVLADASGGPLTVTLPAPDEAIMVTVKKIDSSANAVTIATPGSETIDGDSERTVSAQYVSREIISDGVDYYII